MILATGYDGAVAGDRGVLQVAPQAEVGVAGDQHLVVHRAVRVVADGAALEHGIVPEEERALLGSVALRARLVRGLEVGATPFDDVALVRLMTIRASDLPGEDRVRVGEAKMAAFVEVALEAGLGRLARVDDGAPAAAGGNVDAARPVAGFAAGVADLGLGEVEAGVSGPVEVLRLVLMALGALLRADKTSPRDLGRHEHGAIHRQTGNEEQAPGGHSSEEQGVLSQ